MKAYAIAAGAALLLGTSALAWTPDKAMDGQPMANEAEMAAAVQAKKADYYVATYDPDYDAAYEQGYAPGAYVPAAYDDGVYYDEMSQPQPTLAAYDTWQDGSTWQDDTMPPPEETVPPTGMPTDTGTSFDDTMPPEPTSPADQNLSGQDMMAQPTMAPPAEMRTASAELVPHPAAGNYPPCDPGPGDDHCIQLYEPGVRVALASWDQPTGGLATGEDATMMASADTDYSGTDMASADTVTPSDMNMSSDLGTTADMGTTDMAANEEAGYPVDTSSPYQGVGGPDEEIGATGEMQTGYPACSASVTDRCIQLYERGVTGEGN